VAWSWRNFVKRGVRTIGTWSSPEVSLPNTIRAANEDIVTSAKRVRKRTPRGVCSSQSACKHDPHSGGHEGNVDQGSYSINDEAVLPGRRGDGKPPNAVCRPGQE